VGPANGTVMVVGGGVVGPEIVSRFIAAAGGPDALIVDVPTAGGDSVYPATYAGANFLKAGGARNVVYLHTTGKKVANSDEFAAVLARAGGVWFEGGRQWHLVDSYAGTKTEQAFHDVLARGGVVGGSSAGASILSSYMLRGARSGNEIIMAPGYEVGFGFLRGVAIDQHVVARERLRDLADSLMPKHPELLGISEDEGTAWVIRGDVAEIIGRNKAFVYGGADPTDARKPFLTLYPGDRYDMGKRRLLHRASDESPVSVAMLDSIFGNASGMATVLVARDGKILVDRSYGVPDRSPRVSVRPTCSMSRDASSRRSAPTRPSLIPSAYSRPTWTSSIVSNSAWRTRVRLPCRVSRCRRAMNHWAGTSTTRAAPASWRVSAPRQGCAMRSCVFQQSASPSSYSPIATT